MKQWITSFLSMSKRKGQKSRYRRMQRKQEMSIYEISKHERIILQIGL